MTRRSHLLFPLALAGCLSSPPGSTGPPPPDEDAGPDSDLRLLGVFNRDAFSTSSTRDDLVFAAVYQELVYLVHLRAGDGGLDAVLAAGEADVLPFEPVALVGADANDDDFIDVVATSADGELAILAATDDGLVKMVRAVVLDSGAPFGGITSIEAPDLGGEERVFLFGSEAIWRSDPLSDTDIHFDEVQPFEAGASPPAAFFATHDDDDTWYIGLAHGTAVDLWPLDPETDSVLDTGSEAISFESPDPPEIGYWRRFGAPLKVNFFGLIAETNSVVWASQELGGAELETELDPMADGPILGLTVVQQPEGLDLLTLSEGSSGVIGLQVISPLATPDAPTPLVLQVSLASSIDTSRPFWVQPLEVSASPYAGKELLVFDQAGQVLCATFDAERRLLQPCGEADLRDHMPAWTSGS